MTNEEALQAMKKAVDVLEEMRCTTLLISQQKLIDKALSQLPQAIATVERMCGERVSVSSHDKRQKIERAFFHRFNEAYHQHGATQPGIEVALEAVVFPLLNEIDACGEEVMTLETEKEQLETENESLLKRIDALEVMRDEKPPLRENLIYAGKLLGSWDGWNATPIHEANEAVERALQSLPQPPATERSE